MRETGTRLIKPKWRQWARNIYTSLHTRETCGANVDKQDFSFNEFEDVEDLPMKHFDNAFGTVLSAQTFAEVIFGLQFYVRPNFVRVLEWM